MNINGIELTTEESTGFTDFGEQATMSKLMRVAMQTNKSIGQLLSEATPEYRHALLTKTLKDFNEWQHTNCTPTVQPAVSFITDGDRIQTGVSTPEKLINEDGYVAVILYLSECIWSGNRATPLDVPINVFDIDIASAVLSGDKTKIATVGQKKFPKHWMTGSGDRLKIEWIKPNKRFVILHDFDYGNDVIVTIDDLDLVS